MTTEPLSYMACIPAPWTVSSDDYCRACVTEVDKYDDGTTGRLRNTNKSVYEAACRGEWRNAIDTALQNGEAIPEAIGVEYNAMRLPGSAVWGGNK